MGLAIFSTGRPASQGVTVRGVRLSYVGEAGWEITCPAERADTVYEALHEAGARPTGILAQTSMRNREAFPRVRP